MMSAAVLDPIKVNHHAASDNTGILVLCIIILIVAFLENRRKR